MPLKFPPRWRFQPPRDSEFANQCIPDGMFNSIISLIKKADTRGERQETLEHFKGYFCDAVGTVHSWSSNVSWAETDLTDYALQAAQNAPLFIEAFYDACSSYGRDNPEEYVPDVETINELLARHNVGYEIRLPELVLRESTAPLVKIDEAPSTLGERAMEVYSQSVARSEELLAEGHGREAVQEILWLLESVSTAFRGVETESGTIESKYFNEIVRDLRKARTGTTLDRVLDWLTRLHGYLSSPSGGGVRHGQDLNDCRGMSDNEARLYINLVRSYVQFLVIEHSSLKGAPSTGS